MTHLSSRTESHNRPKVLQNTAVQYGEQDNGSSEEGSGKEGSSGEEGRSKEAGSEEEEVNFVSRVIRPWPSSGRSIGHPRRVPEPLSALKKIFPAAVPACARAPSAPGP
ncbi:MAG TPA: hypothetical protein P5114_06465 [Hyphomicrobiaceae bacterium]|nr:hypothetical protein [Hyphomicrobiaceae bacterium]